jgi:hypothetical protein
MRSSASLGIAATAPRFQVWKVERLSSPKLHLLGFLKAPGVGNAEKGAQRRTAQILAARRFGGDAGMGSCGHWPSPSFSVYV